MLNLVSPSNALSVTTANNAYIPPKDLFAFPPNIQSAYLPPNAMQSQNPVTSYLPPPSGQVDTPPAMNYPGPINPDLMHDPHDHKHDHGIKQ